MNLLFRFWLFQTLISVFSASNADEQTAPWKPAIPFSAEMVVFNRHNPKLQEKTRIQIGKAGMRFTKLTTESEKPFFVAIQNFDTGHTWIASPLRLYYAEIPQVDDSRFVASDKKEGGWWPVTGILDNTPCQGMKGQKMEEHKLKRTRLTVWKCQSSQSGEAYLQHYSTLLGIVVRQESQSGHIVELRDIKLESPDPTSFKPSKLWREVSLKEFFTGTPTLPKYIEEKN